MVYDIEQIQKILPQTYPFLFIDRVVELDPGKRAVAVKNVSMNEWYFQGHFPGKPVMPGMIITEAMAQTSIIIYHSGYEKELKGTPEYYLGSVKVRFFHPVFPGDELKIVAEAAKLLTTGAFISVKAFVQDKLVAESDLVFAVKP